MKNPFEPAPLIVAALTGGVAFWAYHKVHCKDASSRHFGEGLALGALVQIVVRLTGVS